MNVILYHNPKCGTSRTVLQILCEAGLNPQVVEYLKTPLSGPQLTDLADRLGGAHILLRTKEPLAVELGLLEADEADILKAITAHPVLFNRPVVVTDKGARVCRPAALVHEVL